VLSSSTALATQRLAEFLAVVSRASDETAAVVVAIERAAQALEAEVAAVLDSADTVVGSVGFARGRVPVAELVEVVAGQRAELDVPGAGRCQATAAALEGTGRGHLLVARSGEDGFTVDERSLLRGMARVLDLTVESLRRFEAERAQTEENARLVTSLQRRQRLLEEISMIQRAITRRDPLDDILAAIADGAQRLFGDEMVALRMLDPDAPDSLLLVAHRGLSEGVAKRLWRVAVTDRGVSQLAFRRDRVEVMNDYADNPDAVPDGVADRLVSAMAAPVHEGARVVGTVSVGSKRPGRTYGPADREVLRVFAEQVSLAVTDARTQEAMRQAFHDSLTGLASRALFLDRLDHALARAAREGTRLAVLFVDLDRFKNVNDSLGHSAGDRLLAEVAQRLRGCLCEDDTAARLGGDEFAVVLEGVAGDEWATTMARRIIDRLRAPFVIDGQEAFIDASVGIAFNTEPEVGAQALIRNADLAMYQAKKDGKGHYEIFRPAMRSVFLDSLELEARLRRAIGRGDFELRYQPIVELATDRVVGVEALVRWRYAEHVLVGPPEFVPLAEETGLILPIDRWVLSEACRQAGDWNARLGLDRPLTINVNLSARHLQQVDLPEFAASALARGRLDARHLVIEITESLMLLDTEATLDRLHRLRQLGVRVAIDDFGTGYASLAYLRQFPVDIIKIDKSFVAGAGSGAVAEGNGAGAAGLADAGLADAGLANAGLAYAGLADAGLADAGLAKAGAPALARGIVQLGQTLRLATIAEGIETAEQLAELRAAGCRYGQGYYFAPPVTAGDIEELLRERAGAAVRPALVRTPA
jgi:diguanylate cyclase (GGDEF)-like protein